MLTEFYERCSKYYGAAGGQGAYGCASEDEKRLTMTLFLSIFESLAQMDYDPELFGKVHTLVNLTTHNSLKINALKLHLKFTTIHHM